MPPGFKALRFSDLLTVVPLSPFGPFPAGRTNTGLSMSPLSVGIFHSPPSGIQSDGSLRGPHALQLLIHYSIDGHILIFMSSLAQDGTLSS